MLARMPGMGELIVMLLILSMTGVWIWMLVDCIQYESGAARSCGSWSSCSPAS